MAKAKDDDLEAILAAYPGKRAPTCSLRNNRDHDDLLRRLGEHGMTYAMMAKFLGDRFGVVVRGQTVSRHLRKECGCWR